MNKKKAKLLKKIALQANMGNPIAGLKEYKELKKEYRNAKQGKR